MSEPSLGGGGGRGGAHASSVACAHASPLVASWKKHTLLVTRRLENYRRHELEFRAELPPPRRAARVHRLPPLRSPANERSTATATDLSASSLSSPVAASTAAAAATIAYHNPLRDVQAKVGSLENADHKPGGGHVKIHSERLSWAAVARVGSLDNVGHVPGGGVRRRGAAAVVVGRRLGPDGRDAAVYVRHAVHPPVGATVAELTANLAHVKAKVGSLDNFAHRPGGGNVAIFDELPHWTARSRVDSLSNVHHVPTTRFSLNSERLSPLRKKLKLMKDRVVVWTHGRGATSSPVAAAAAAGAVSL